MIDIMTLIISGNAEENFEFWGLDDEKIEGAKEYYEDHKRELEEILDNRTPDALEV